MSALNLTAKQINQNVPKKLKLLNVHSTRERHGDFFLDGKFQFRVTLPNEHGGTLTPLWLKTCRDSVFLSASEYADLARCPMTGEDYEQIIRKKLGRR